MGNLPTINWLAGFQPSTVSLSFLRVFAPGNWLDFPLLPAERITFRSTLSPKTQASNIRSYTVTVDGTNPTLIVCDIYNLIAPVKTIIHYTFITRLQYMISRQIYLYIISLKIHRYTDGILYIPIPWHRLNRILAQVTGPWSWSSGP